VSRRNHISMRVDHGDKLPRHCPRCAKILHVNVSNGNTGLPQLAKIPRKIAACGYEYNNRISCVREGRSRHLRSTVRVPLASRVFQRGNNVSQIACRNVRVYGAKRNMRNFSRKSNQPNPRGSRAKRVNKLRNRTKRLALGVGINHHIPGFDDK